MDLIKSKIFFLCFMFASCFFFPAFSQTNEAQIDPAKKYEDLIKIQDTTKTQEPIAAPQTPPAIEEKPDELVLFLPKLDPTLYANWNASAKPIIWTEGNPSIDFLQENQELFNELKLEKILKQTYTKETNSVDVLIYKFKDFTGAYSAYTVLHGGATTKLKVGKNASESEKLVNFWKGNYFIDIHTSSNNNSIEKEFVILASQDISKNIQIEQMPPVVAIQLPALNRVQGTEKYCFGSVCCKKYLIGNTLDCALFNLSESGGVISAQYQTDGLEDKERIALVLTRYTTKESAKAVFDSIKEYFEKQKSMNKEMEIDFDIDDSIFQIKNGKNNYTMLKQKGNLLTVAYNITNTKTGKQVLALIPWPVEITKPITGSEK